MRTALILFLLSFFVFQLPLEASSSPMVTSQSSTQKEKADPNQWDFGQIKEGLVLKHEFILKNQTNDILKINNIHTSCGCAVSESAKKSLLPLESTVITVSFNSKGYFGPVTQFVYVHTDNADMQIVKFTIKAEVQKGD